MKTSSARLLAPLLFVVLPAAAAAAQGPLTPTPLPDPPEPGMLLTVPTLAAEAGPLFDLAAVAERLGGRVEERRGDSWALLLGEREILFGPASPAVALGTDIVPLSQAPRVADRRIFVPLDFLETTYGRLSEYAFTWDASARTLAAVRRRARVLTVATDAVHQQGVTTVVLQFDARPRYRLVERPGGYDVVMSGDRLRESAPPPGGAAPLRDPLVAAVEVDPDRVGVDLVPGAVADSYTLENPFRIVFDVVRGSAAAAPETPQVEPPRRTPGIRTIVLDPGHGGGESGAVGPGGTLEKELTLLLARALKSRLEAALGVRVILTRDEDAELPHETRTAIANQHKADLFVSLHLNSAFGAGARGAETYFLSETASDDRAARSAAAENRLIEGAEEDPLHDLQLILWDLAQSHHLAQSQRLATLIQQELNGALGLRDRGVKQAPFLVLMGAAMPAVLVELGFISNPEEERRLRDPAYRAQLTGALVRAIGTYKAEVEAGEAAAAAPAAAAGDGARGNGR